MDEKVEELTHKANNLLLMLLRSGACQRVINSTVLIFAKRITGYYGTSLHNNKAVKIDA